MAKRYLSYSNETSTGRLELELSLACLVGGIHSPIDPSDFNAVSPEVMAEFANRFRIDGQNFYTSKAKFLNTNYLILNN